MSMNPRTMATWRAQTNVAAIEILESLPGVDPSHVETVKKLSREGGGPKPGLALDNQTHTAELIAAPAEAVADLEKRLAELENQLLIGDVA